MSAVLPARQGWVNRLAGSRAFQAFCARVPGLRRIARAEGAAIFDLMQGFVQSQTLCALVELRLLHILAEGPAGAPALARRTGVPEARMAVLLQAGAAMRLLRRRGTEYALARRGAAFLAVPGLEGMVRHDAVLYGDLNDPAAFFRGETDPALAHFWPYVFGAGAAEDPAQAAAYSRLMAETQTLVAEEVLAVADLGRHRRLMDVGGGTGAFLRAVRARHPGLELALFDLPAVVAQAALPADVTRHSGSFRDDPLPRGADAISLIRVLYDHSDETVTRLLTSVREALPPRGRLLIAEPMSGGARPDPQTDVYFAVYTLAMQTGRTRSVDEIAAALRAAGFSRIVQHPAHRPYVARALSAWAPV
jgi:demethylspheroidene O-methyltransferase